MLTARALVKAFSADVVEALKSEVVSFLAHSANVNCEMGKNNAEAQPQCRQGWLIQAVVLPWDGAAGGS